MIKKGDVVKVDYTGRLEDGTIFDTTIEEDARKGNIYDEKIKYKPAVLIVGGEQAIEGLEEAIMKMEVGEEKEVNIPYQKAFGPKNPDLLNIVPLTKFHSQNIDPKPGMVVTVDGRDGMVKSVSGGRVIVDFNHPLAGQNLKYKIKVISVLEKLDEKIAALFEDSDLAGNISLDKQTLIVNAKTDKSYDYIIKKDAFLRTIAKFFPEIETIKFNEEYKLEDFRREEGKKKEE